MALIEMHGCEGGSVSIGRSNVEMTIYCKCNECEAQASAPFVAGTVTMGACPKCGGKSLTTVLSDTAPSWWKR